jgi:hypothetical protein
MMTLRRRCIATEALLAAASLLLACAAGAAPAGTIVRATGPVFTQAADGRIKALSVDSAVASGDTLVTGHETFAQVRFTDGGMATLGPDTRIAIDADGPSRVTLELGALQVIGAPGIAERQIHTPGGVIRAGNATFVIEHVAGDPGKVAAAEPLRLASLSLTLSDAIVVAQLQPPGSQGSGLAPGLYVHVIDGIIHLTNNGGAQSFSAGQFGYTASFIKPPVIVPNNPGLQFSPPPSFSSSSAPQSGANKSGAVDCEVR